MRYLTLTEVLELHGQIISQSGGTPGILNLNALESALAQPRMTFGGTDLYPTITEKAATLGFSLIKNHLFVDGNKRTGHAALEVFLVLNGFEIRAPVDGKSGSFFKWLRANWIATSSQLGLRRTSSREAEDTPVQAFALMGDVGSEKQLVIRAPRDEVGHSLRAGLNP